MYKYIIKYVLALYIASMTIFVSFLLDGVLFSIQDSNLSNPSGIQGLQPKV